MKNENKPPALNSENESVVRKNKVIPKLLTALLEWLVLAVFTFGMIYLFQNGFKTLGLVIITILCFFVMLGRSLIFWKKRRDERNDSIEKEG